jgi:AraC-like DNA-binding protein
VEKRPVTVHQGQHFRARHSPLSCSGAPIFDPEGALAAVLDVSSIDPRVSAGAHALTLPLVTASARSIEEQLFRRRFLREWILALAPLEEEGAGCLLAVDKEDRVVGADRSGRRVFGITAEHLARGLSVWTLFTRASALLQRSEPGVDKTVILTTASGARPLCALVSAPLPAVRARMDPLRTAFLMRPRIPLLAECARTFAAERPRGGLSPGARRRVCEHIESHLQGNIALRELAAQARLSVFHFAHAFRESLGVSPHRYLLQQRVKRAEQLLADTELPLASIATAVGFADQSHLARHFSRLLGTTPSAFRRAQR